MHFNQLITFKT